MAENTKVLNSSFSNTMIQPLQSGNLTIFAEKEKRRFKLKVGVCLFLVQNDEILLLRRFNTGIDDGLYVVPMGGHDGKEPLTQALIREAEEETGIVLKPANVQLCHVMHRFHPMPEGLSFEQIDMYFKAEIYDGVVENMEPNKCDELKFYPMDNLPANTAPFIKHAIQSMLQGQFYSEFGWQK